MKNGYKCFVCSIASCLIVGNAIEVSFAQDNIGLKKDRKAFPKCQEINADKSGKDKKFTNCFTPAVDEFYGAVLVDFDLRQSDVDSILSGMDKKDRKKILKSIKNIFINNNDIAYVILTARALHPQRPPVSLGARELFTVTKGSSGSTFSRIWGGTGSTYNFSIQKHYGPLPVRFIADNKTQVELNLVIASERQAESKIFKLLGDLSQFAGIFISSVATLKLTQYQKQFVALDKELSRLLSDQNNIVQSIPLNFDPKYAQAYESEFALREFIPSQAGLRIRFNVTADSSIFPGISPNSSAQGDVDQKKSTALYAPGGFEADKFKHTNFMNQAISNYILAELGQENYDALSRGADEDKFNSACNKMNHYLTTGPLPLSAYDKLRVSWAHISGNKLLENKKVRENYCLKNKEANLAALGLGLPEIAKAPLDDFYFLLKGNAEKSAHAADNIVSEAISKRNAAQSASERATAQLTASPEAQSDTLLVKKIGTYHYAGEALADGQVALGVAVDTRPDRQGNRYAGEVMYINNKLVLQGLGEYVASQNSQDLRYKVYTGRFENNLGDGYGEIVFTDGKRFTGEVSRETPHGYGVWNDPDGALYYAKASDGERKDKAVKRDQADGSLIAGRFVNHEQFRADDE